MSEKTFSQKIKTALRKEGWTVINLESIGEGVPDCLIAKNKKVFFIEFKFLNNRLTKEQVIFMCNNIRNIDCYILRKKSNSISLSKSSTLLDTELKSTLEVVEFFERRIAK